MQTESVADEMEFVEDIGDKYGERIQTHLKYILYCDEQRSRIFSSDHLHMVKRNPGEIEIKFFPNGMKSTGEVWGATGETVGKTLLNLSQYVVGIDEEYIMQLAEALGMGKVSPDVNSPDVNSDEKMRHGINPDNIEEFANELDEREEEREEESLIHEIEVEHNADDFEEELDFETQMLQLAQESDTDDDVARVTNYVPKPATDSVVLLIELPNQSRGKAVYDIPTSTDAPLVDVLDVAVSEDRTEKISLENIELIAGALIPVVGSDDVWAVETEGEVEVDFDADLDPDEDQSESGSTWGKSTITWESDTDDDDDLRDAILMAILVIVYFVVQYGGL